MFRKKVHALIHQIKQPKSLSFIAIILLVLAIPFTVFIAQKQQELRQHASENQATIQVTPNTIIPGTTVTVAWTLGASSESPAQPPAKPIEESGNGSAAVGVSPTSVTRGGNITLEWRYRDGLLPHPTDYLEIFVGDGQHVGSLYMSSNCGANPGDTPSAEGSCIFSTQPIGPSTYTVKVMRNGNPLGPQASFTVSAESGFIFIPRAYAQTAFTGGETLQLFTAATQQPAGRKIYLNCEETTTTPPTTPITSGTCAYPISADMPEGSYMFRMYAADGVTLLSETPLSVKKEALATIPGRIIVVYDTENPQRQQAAVDESAAEAVRTIQSLAVDAQEIAPETTLVTTQPGKEDELIAAYKKQPNVAEVMPDYALTLYSTPNDPLFSQQKGMETIKVPTAWNSGQGQGIKIAILDTGIASHQDLQERIGLQKDFLETGLTPTDAHGTVVAGIAAATYNNNTGIAGVAGKATLLNAKVDVGTSISLAAALNAIRWATDNGAKVINMSFGSRTFCLPVYQDVIDYAWSHGVVVIAAAGNDGANTPIAPASCNHVVAVGATNTGGTTKTSFSNYGDSVALAAPGENELTTTMNDTYAHNAGTSVSAPYVAGVAALLFEKYPTASPDFIKDKLYATAKPITGFSKGLVDATAALNDTTPPAPTIIPTSIPTPTSVQTACNPRPPVTIRTAANGDGRQRVTVSSTENAATTTNSMQSISWTGISNSIVEGIESATQGNSTTLAAGTKTVTFFVKRITPGQASTVAFTVTDVCGPWKTFVGGGPNAF